MNLNQYTKTQQKKQLKNCLQIKVVQHKTNVMKDQNTQLMTVTNE